MALRLADLTPEQRTVLREIKAGARRNGATPMEVKAAIETGIVEANLTNPSGGDADSAGWRQERASLYKDPQNIRASVDRIFKEMKAVRGKYGSAGDLAAAVQRPAAQYRGRYQEHSAEAQALLGGGSIGALSGEQLAQPRQPTMAPTPVAAPAVDTMAQRLEAVRMLQRGQSSPLDFALQIKSLDTPAAQAPARDEPAALPSEPKADTQQPFDTGAGSGAFKITGPNPGRLQPVLVSFAQKVAGVYGHTLTGSDGTGHSKYTVDGNVSQHFTGNATDIPATGKTLIAMGQAALIAAGMPEKQARKQTGGLFNVGSHQVIFNTHLGGDHTNHLHISAK